MAVEKRFLKYVSYWTTSEDDQENIPSTKRQFELAKVLEQELKELNLEKVKLDEILKFLFNSSEKVLVKLLNSMFDENFKEDEVSVTITNSEFVEDTLEILRGDMFFKIFDKANKDFEKHKMNYHLEFQTKNDNTMIIRMFEYGFRKGKENANEGKDNIKKLYFQK